MSAFDHLETSAVSRAAEIVLRKTPKPHQQDALVAIRDTLESADRARVVQACGTGKTLTALWAAGEHLQGLGTKTGTVVVFVPTLALLAQTLREWKEQAPWVTPEQPLRYLCVCSDTSVDERASVMSDTDDPDLSGLSVPPCTDPAIVRAFLDGAADPSCPSILFCTYASAPVVGDAVRGTEDRPEFRLDLGVFDEAHKTASSGRAGESTEAGDVQDSLSYSRNAYALDDARLPIAKRLFFTATERIVVRSENRDQAPDAEDDEGVNAFDVVSMDNETLYGPRAYHMGFAQAVREGLIVGYEIIISVVGQARVADALASGDARVHHGRPEVFGLAQGLTVSEDANEVAAQVALVRGMERMGARKAITYHARIASAKSFAQSFRAMAAYHVNGHQSASERSELLEVFGAAERAVMTNSRCLTEGIDVPSVDMVAFMDPRNSTVDIVQAAGRAMRRAPGKSKGYILVPLHVDLTAGLSIGESVARSDFRKVMEVLRSLGESEDGVRDIRTWLRTQDDGHTGSVGPNVRVVGDPELVDIERIVEAVQARLVVLAKPQWTLQDRIESIRGHVADCTIPDAHEQAGWVSHMRRVFRKSAGRLDPEVERAFKELGLWLAEPPDDLPGRIAAIRGYVSNGAVPATHPQRSWINGVRKTFRSTGRIDPAVAQAFEELQLWLSERPGTVSLAERIESIRGCVVEGSVPATHPQRKWVSGIRGEYRKTGRMNLEVAHAFKDLGLWLEAPPDKIALADRVASIRGQVVNQTILNTHAQYPWLNAIRQKYRKTGLIDPEVAQALRDLGLWIDTRPGELPSRVEAIRGQVVNGTIPTSHPQRTWVQSVRNSYRMTGTVRAEFKQAFQELGLWLMEPPKKVTLGERIASINGHVRNGTISDVHAQASWVNNIRGTFRNTNRVDPVVATAFRELGLWLEAPADKVTLGDRLAAIRNGMKRGKLPVSHSQYRWLTRVKRQFRTSGLVDPEVERALTDLGLLGEAAEGQHPPARAKPCSIDDRFRSLLGHVADGTVASSHPQCDWVREVRDIYESTGCAEPGAERLFRDLGMWLRVSDKPSAIASLSSTSDATAEAADQDEEEVGAAADDVPLEGEVDELEEATGEVPR
jgi:hypothetical protein